MCNRIRVKLFLLHGRRADYKFVIARRADNKFVIGPPLKNRKTSQFPNEKVSLCKMQSVSNVRQEMLTLGTAPDLRF